MYCCVMIGAAGLGLFLGGPVGGLVTFALCGAILERQ